MSLSTHVLDAVRGRPAAGILVRLESGDEWRMAAEARTDSDGRIARLGDPQSGIHRLRFDTGAYFEELGVEAFYPEVTVSFTVGDPAAHYHVPLLLSPFAYSTYRGS